MNTESLTIYLNADPQTRSLIDELASQLVTSQRELELSRKAGSAIMATAQSQADELTALRSEPNCKNLALQAECWALQNLVRSHIMITAAKAMVNEWPVKVTCERHQGAVEFTSRVLSVDNSDLPIKLEDGEWYYLASEQEYQHFAISKLEIVDSSERVEQKS